MRIASDLAVRPRLGENVAMALMLQVVDQVYQEVLGGDSSETCITSGIDGKHMQNSLHYVGRALDFRTRHLRDDQPRRVAELISKRLGPSFDVILEADHLHVEWQARS